MDFLHVVKEILPPGTVHDGILYALLACAHAAAADSSTRVHRTWHDSVGHRISIAVYVVLALLH
jgi:hypothetical protein